MNKRLRILIVEDDPIIAEDLAAYMDDFGYEALDPVDNADSAIKTIRKEKPDLCLLDVHLNSEINGIQLAAMINDIIEVPIVFLTAFNDRDTVEKIKATHPAAYLVKPVDEKNLQTSLEIAFSNFNREGEHSEKSVHKDSIFIKIKDRLSKFNYDDILYFEAYDNYAFLHTAKDRQIVSASLKQVEEKLDPSIFIRTHRSYIVNISKVDGIGSSKLKVGKAEIPIGKTYRTHLLEQIDQL